MFADDPIEGNFARMRDREERFAVWLEHLRGGNPRFSEASALGPGDWGEWQSVTLSGLNAETHLSEIDGLGRR